MQSPIIITGIPRSGTSLTSGIIELCGAFGGDTAEPNKHNPKGMFENDEIRNYVLKPYFKELGYDPRGQFPLPPITENLPKQPRLREKFEKIIRRQGYNGGKYYYKGAKIILIWPVWHCAFSNAKWVLVRRNREDIANSCVRTSFMDTFVNEEYQKKVDAKNEYEGWLWWVDFHNKRINEMLESNINIKQVWPEEMINGNFDEIKSVIDWLDLEWKEDKVKKFVEPEFWNNKKGK